MAECMYFFTQPIYRLQSCFIWQARSTAVLSGAAESPPPPQPAGVGGGESEEGLSGPATFLPKIRPEILGFTLGFINVSLTVHIN